MKLVILLVLCLIFANSRWTADQANIWYSKYNWKAGVNYTPAYAVNEIQFWLQYNSTQVQKELMWAKNVGFSVMRVFLHIIPFIHNAKQFITNIRDFLDQAQKNQISIIFVLFDDCWNPQFHDGKQPQPIPGIHNSQWVQMPGNFVNDTTLFKLYVQDIITAFGKDKTVVMWDLYNEVGNSDHKNKSLPLTQMIFSWARQVRPSQPLTSGYWNGGQQFKDINSYILSQSDVITFHAYCDEACTKSSIAQMKSYGRPVICTEYMARPLNSKFISHLPIFKQNNVWAINWGFVFGRTQTYYPWWSKLNDPVPDVWFHDVLHPDGKPFDENQTNFIKNITGTSTVI